MLLSDVLNPYSRVMAVRRWLYKRGILRSSHPGIPVISIGNLAMGGTGKSPVTIMIARHLLLKKKQHVAIVSRGYGRKTRGYVLVRDGTQLLAKVEESGDEAQMMALALPSAIVIVDEDRQHAARQARNLGATAILMDDGYQHLGLKRDLNILLVDAGRGLSHVLPFGSRREPLSAAGDAELLVFTNSSPADHHEAILDDLQPYLRKEISVARVCGVPGELVSLTSGTSLPTSDLPGRVVVALSSIGTPGRFHNMLKDCGAVVIEHPLRDHAAYDETLVRKLFARAVKENAAMIVTTEKDGVKLRRFVEHQPTPVPVYVLKYDLEFLEGREGFYALIDQLF